MRSKIKILLFVVLSITLIGLIGWNKPELSSSSIEKDFFWTFKTHSKEKHDIVVFGDSRTYRGISATELTKGYPDYSAINLGYSSAGMDNIMFDFIESRLDMKKDPQIILGITPYSFTPDAIANKHFLQEMEINHFTVLQRTYFVKYIKFFEPFTPQDIHPVGKKNSIGFQYFEKFYNTGWVASYTIPTDTNRALKNYRKSFTNNTVSLESTNNLLKRIILWKEKGIKVYGFRPPTAHAMVRLEEEIGGFREKEFIRSFEVAGGVWLSLDNESFITYDGSHLDFNEAKRMSQKIKEKIFSYK